MKKITAIGSSILIVASLATVSYQSYAVIKTDIQAPVLKSVATAFNITDMIIANGEANDTIRSIIEGMEDALRDTESKEAKELLKRLKRQWKSDRKRLNNAIHTRVQMLATMEKGHPLSML